MQSKLNVIFNRIIVRATCEDWKLILYRCRWWHQKCSSHYDCATLLQLRTSSDRTEFCHNLQDRQSADKHPNTLKYYQKYFHPASKRLSLFYSSRDSHGLLCYQMHHCKIDNEIHCKVDNMLHTHYVIQHYIKTRDNKQYTSVIDPVNSPPCNIISKSTMNVGRKAEWSAISLARNNSKALQCTHSQKHSQKPK